MIAKLDRHALEDLSSSFDHAANIRRNPIPGVLERGGVMIRPILNSRRFLDGIKMLRDNGELLDDTSEIGFVANLLSTLAVA